ncbi:hypothetical protein JB92DRAFT_3035530 [Gautieria morchelliformis]|nr:hypothetical protein JB92DRAFT_3035530 [Gautieria morchelliformis]
MQAGPFVPSNAFSSLIISGLIKINGVQVPLTLSKAISKPAKSVLTTVEANATVGGLPPIRPPSKLPPSEPERLGYGRVGSVYPLRIEDTNQYVAARRRSDDLARKAWFYEELEDIQGVAIARCYGFFTPEIEQNKSDADYDEEEVDVWDEASPSEDDDDSDEPWDPYACWQKVFKREDEREKPDVHEIYSDMGRFGVEHMDIRSSNIMAAPATDQSVVCPYHGHRHQWRVVDFDCSRKSNYSHSHIESAAGGWLRTILDGLEEGYVVEPWD